MDSREFATEDWSHQISQRRPPYREVRKLTFAYRVNLIWPLSVALDVASDLDAVFQLVFEDVNLQRRVSRSTRADPRLSYLVEEQQDVDILEELRRTDRLEEQQRIFLYILSVKRYTTTRLRLTRRFTRLSSTSA